ncbi:ATP-grasp domain-containing protein [Herbivorax sp. ANBcel31]|uniref:ATP-grasp domain-containing protein n=1 Tax=Herbivorax sp. ANBcel31 TaxID=3069754 RepID=UPI0027B02DB4|nr:ATP-grasp domain-containing protein [Herbivorax sp. ANBcel31]MDQ2085657.1 ATP-grasp domain-containing protein [Herbivorax sp. ANBcel31]
MKKILLLGGSTQQVPAIEYSKKKGYYTILCDFLPNNPGQHYAEKFYCLSTTDKEKMLEIAKKEKVDGVVAYASDPAAPTAAYVSEKMGLSTNSYKSVEILAYKDKFRDFLKKNNFNCPHAEYFKSYEEAEKSINRFRLPVIVKPIDSSGSKGVNRVDSIKQFKRLFDLAMENSKSKNVIVEEFIKMDHKYMVGGDCFVLNGKVSFCGLLNCHRNSNVNSLVPVGKSYPVQISQLRVNKIKEEIQKVVDLLDIKFGGFNLEIMFDNEGRLYLIEMGPRNGGNMIPELLNISTGVDLVAATVETAMGNSNIDVKYFEKESYFSTFNLHTDKKGLLKDVIFDKQVENKIIKKVLYKKQGDLVQYFDGANKAIGIIFLKFNSMDEMINIMDNSSEKIKIIVD